MYSISRHSRESGNPGPRSQRLPWTPAFAGVTISISPDPVALDRGAVELDAEARAIRELDRAVAFEAQRVLQELIADRVGVLVPFEHQRVGDCRGEMQRGDEVDRAGE